MEKEGGDSLKKLQVPIQEINIFTGFIDYIIGQLYQNLMNSGRNLFSTDEFKSFYYIKENVKADISYFFYLILEEDSMGFIPVKRNIRISSEALLDLYNLVYVNDYKTVLQYMEDRCNYSFSEKFERYCYKNNFTILSKLKIAKGNGFGDELDFLESGLLTEANKYIHASIFVQPNNVDLYSKLNDARKLLLIELNIYQKAIECLCGKYDFNFQTYSCQYQCSSINSYTNVMNLSFDEVYEECSNKIYNMLFVDIYPQNPYNYM